MAQTSYHNEMQPNNTLPVPCLVVINCDGSEQCLIVHRTRVWGRKRVCEGFSLGGSFHGKQLWHTQIHTRTKSILNGCTPSEDEQIKPFSQINSIKGQCFRSVSLALQRDPAHQWPLHLTNLCGTVHSHCALPRDSIQTLSQCLSQGYWLKINLMCLWMLEISIAGENPWGKKPPKTTKKPNPCTKGGPKLGFKL